MYILCHAINETTCDSGMHGFGEVGGGGGCCGGVWGDDSGGGFDAGVSGMMDIGTAKPDAATRGRIPHLMIDVADAWESYSAARFCGGGAAVSEKVCGPLVLVAGTFLYVAEAAR